MSFKDLEGQMAQWLEILGTYDHEIVYRPEAKYGNADALSKQPCSRGECGFCYRTEARHKPRMIRSVVQLQGMEVRNVI